MQDDKPKFEGQILSKKAKVIDEEPSRKKNKKHKRKGQDQDEWQELKPIKQQPIKSMTKQKSQNEENAQILKELCIVLSAYKHSTIKKILQKNNYDKQEAMNILLDLPPDNEEDDFAKDIEKIEYLQTRDSGDTSGATSENANNLMIQVFQTLMREEINGRQFEQLFQEIAEMIKTDQKQKGVGMLEINNFVDQCNSIKQILLVGFREELTNFDDFQFDQNYQLYPQTQKFLQQKIKEQIQQEKKNKEDFPTLGRESKSNKRNIIDRIKQQQKKKKEQQYLFTPNRNTLPQYARERNNQCSIFNVDNKLKSEKDLLSLHKQFSDMPILDLKFIYKTFGGDFNICRQFLIKNYGQKRAIRVIQKNPIHLPRQTHKKVMYSNKLSMEEVDQQLRHLSLQQLREQIDHLFKLKQALQLTKMKIKGSGQKLQLDRIINQKAPIIRKLSQASRLLLVDQMTAKNPLYVDFHGYREEEIYPLLDRIGEMIKIQYYKGNQKIRLRKLKGRSTACLIVMTGKGLHSRGNTSILKPKVAQWCKANGYDCEEDDDHIKVYMAID